MKGESYQSEVLNENKVPVHRASKGEMDSSYIYHLIKYSKTCVKRPLKTRQNTDLNDKW